MFIKYKGNTSRLLTDLSLEIGNKVDLKSSEALLLCFFQRALKETSIEKSIQIVSGLPTYLKPFCQKSFGAFEIEHELFHSGKLKNTLQAILKVLEKHVPAENLPVIYSCFPETFFPEIFLSGKEVCLAA
jgi:hypothetical protein